MGVAWAVKSKAIMHNLLPPFFFNLHFSHFLLKFKNKGGISMFKFLQKINDINPWKAKAKKRSDENKDLKKTIKRLKNSRDKWKEKASKLEKKTVELNNELKKI